MLRPGRVPGKQKAVLKLGSRPESELQLGPRWALDLEPGSKSMSALKPVPGVKQMRLEPRLVCGRGLGLGPLEKLEPEGALKPETMSEWDPLVVLVPWRASGLGLVLQVMLESMTMSELDMRSGGSQFPWRVSEMETSH